MHVIIAFAEGTSPHGARLWVLQHLHNTFLVVVGATAGRSPSTCIVDPFFRSSFELSCSCTTDEYEALLPPREEFVGTLEILLEVHPISASAGAPLTDSNRELAVPRGGYSAGKRVQQDMLLLRSGKHRVAEYWPPKGIPSFYLVHSAYSVATCVAT